MQKDNFNYFDKLSKPELGEFVKAIFPTYDRRGGKFDFESNDPTEPKVITVTFENTLPVMRLEIVNDYVVKAIDIRDEISDIGTIALGIFSSDALRDRFIVKDSEIGNPQYEYLKFMIKHFGRAFAEDYYEYHQAKITNKIDLDKELKLLRMLIDEIVDEIFPSQQI